jgi:DNA-binding response OmpR family regulator
MSFEDVQSDRNLVLILENDELVGKGLALILRDAGYQTIVFKSFRDARDSVDASATAVSAIISDYDLDSGPNGVEAARALRATHQPEPPVLIVTATQQRDVFVAARAAGFDVSFKPASPAFLRQWLAHNTAGRLRSPLQ